MGGENSSSRAQKAAGVGSSPRGRGKLQIGELAPPAHGLIPAWAGKTYCSMAISALTRAHPRVGGENWLLTANKPPCEGSSPRGRGKRRGSRCENPRTGLIPAWAGKTSQANAHTAAARAHPRVGGENSSRISSRDCSSGSSPRGRGKRDHDLADTNRAGLIPAWAGKTNSGGHNCCSPAAHPRVGGENEAGRQQLARLGGSSPRGRGKPD